MTQEKPNANGFKQLANKNKKMNCVVRQMTLAYYYGGTSLSLSLPALLHRKKKCEY